MKIRNGFLFFLLAFLSIQVSWAEIKDVTSLLANPKGDDSLTGWQTTSATPVQGIGNAWKITQAYDETLYGRWGFWGFQAPSFECWGSFPGATSLTQTISGLKNGTYVFGAYALALHGESQTFLFANQASVKIASKGDPFAYAANPEAHAVRVYVTTQVTDGTLTVGVRSMDTNEACWVMVDNFCLYYGGEASKEQTLLALRASDVETVKAQARALQSSSISEEAYADLGKALDAATVTSPAQCDASEEGIRRAMCQAGISADRFLPLTAQLKEAEMVASKKWSDEVSESLKTLNTTIKDTKGSLAAHTIKDADVKGLCTQLKEQTKKIHLDELFTILKELEKRISDYKSTPSTAYYLPSLQSLYDRASTYKNQLKAGTVSMEPANAFVAKMKMDMALCRTTDAGTLTIPAHCILLADPEDSSKAYVHWRQNSDILRQPVILQSRFATTLGGENAMGVRVESPWIHSTEPCKELLLTVLHTCCDQMPGHYGTRDALQDDGPYFGIHELYIFDKEGKRVALKAENFQSNAKEPNQGTYGGLVDNNLDKEFYSRWTSEAKGTGAHTLSVTLPEPMYDFKIAIEETWKSSQVADMPTELYITGK